MITTAAESAVSARPGGRRRSRHRMRTYLIGWSFILPNLIGFGVLTLYPVLTLFYISFTNWDIFGTAHWIGIANYQRLVSDNQFHTALLNTLYYCAITIPLTLVTSLSLALLLNTKLRGVMFFRTAAFFPYITSIVAIAVVWNLLFSPQYGPVNEVLRALGIAHPPGWLTSDDWAMPAVAIISTWRDMGYYMVLFLAGLQAVPRELHEAARVDGANAFQRFVSVTVPMLRPTTFFVIVILTINSFKVFDLILVMTQGGPGTSTLVLSQFIYRVGFTEYHFGYASAASVVLFLLAIVTTIVQFAVNRRGEVR
jgi:multiple sugar transport system permease protein/alpha-1,4-digalacturonate transport system permease protein